MAEIAVPSPRQRYVERMARARRPHAIGPVTAKLYARGHLAAPSFGDVDPARIPDAVTLAFAGTASAEDGELAKIRAEIAQTVAGPGEIEDEIRHLFSALSA